MNKGKNLTRVGALRLNRKEGIVRDFNTFHSKDPISVIVSRIAKKWRVSETTVRKVLTAAGLIGRKNNDKRHD